MFKSLNWSVAATYSFLVAYICYSPLPLHAQTKPDCAAAVAAAPKQNAFQLFDGTTLCAQENKIDDMIFLLMLGQVRALSDMAVLLPKDEADQGIAAQLYQTLFYKLGGLGPDDFYRSPENVARLEARIRATRLEFAAEYDPGWHFKASSKTDAYQAVIDNGLEHRIWQMRNAALDLQNDAYFAAETKEAELRRRNPVLKQGTPAYDEDAKLIADMREAAKGIVHLPPPVDTTPYARLSEPDPEVASRELAKGLNGPSKGGYLLIGSLEEMRNSWLGHALPAAKMEALAAQVDFNRSVLIAVAAGEHETASGTIHFSGLAYSAAAKGYFFNVLLGIVPEACGSVKHNSYPFVVGVVDLVQGAKVTASALANFPDSCGAIAEAASSDPN